MLPEHQWEKDPAGQLKQNEKQCQKSFKIGKQLQKDQKKKQHDIILFKQYPRNTFYHASIR